MIFQWRSTASEEIPEARRQSVRNVIVNTGPTHCFDQSWFLFPRTLLKLCSRNCTGGYYLTSAYGAMALIKNFQEEQAARVLSSEARDTLHQWHRRRTAQRLAPSLNDFQVSHLT